MSDQAVNNKKKPEAGTNKTAETNPLKIVDMGKYARQKIKRFKKGKGRLMTDVNDLVDDMQKAGEIPAGAQPLVILVRQKPKKLRLF